MQFPKIALVICAFATASTAMAAEDNAEQAAARALLVSKLFEISGESTPAHTATPPPKPAAQNPAPSISTTTRVIPAAKSEDDSVMHPVNRPTTPGYSTRPPTDSEARYRILRTPHQEIQNPPISWTKPVPEATVKNTASASPRTAPANNQPATAPAPAAINARSEFAPIAAPVSPIGAGKQQKLVDLLAKYKADQISPEEYHRQRAAILNGF
jgi:hypothetical protein